MRWFTRAAFLGLFLFIVAATPIVATAQEGGGEGTGAEHHVGFWDRIAKQLNLTPSQQTLLEGVKTATRAYFVAARDVHRETHQAYTTEAAQPSPNFDKAGQVAKAAFQRQVVSAHDALTEAKTAFYKSLTPEQLKKIASFGNQGGGRGRGHMAR